MQHPIPIEELPENLRKFVDPKGPVPARMMAAKGMVPLGPTDLVTVMYMLAHDPDGNVAAAANEKCTTLPENIVEGALGSPLDNRVLDFYADKLFKFDDLLEIILLNHSTGDETVARMARRVNERLAEIIATNEQRLLGYPAIIEQLYQNRNARMSTVTRLVELAVRNGIQLTGIAAHKEVEAAIQSELIFEPEGDEPLPADNIFMESLRIGDALEQEIGSEGMDDLDAGADERDSLEAQIGNMNTSEKIRLAQVGNASARSLLVRDANKLVAMAAIKAPSVKDTEIVGYVRNRALCEDVVRYISNQKEWTKLYQVKLNLVENPKTPLPKAMTFLLHLRLPDIRTISRSKNVPAAVAKAAKMHVKRRQC